MSHQPLERAKLLTAEFSHFAQKVDQEIASLHQLELNQKLSSNYQHHLLREKLERDSHIQNLTDSTFQNFPNALD